MQKFVVALKFTDAFVGNKKTEKQRKMWGKGRCRGILSFFYLSLCRLLWIVIHQTFQRTSLIYKYVKNHWRYISVFMKSDWYAIELAVSLHKLQTSLGKRRYHEARSILEDKQKKNNSHIRLSRRNLFSLPSLTRILVCTLLHITLAWCGKKLYISFAARNILYYENLLRSFGKSNFLQTQLFRANSRVHHESACFTATFCPAFCYSRCYFCNDNFSISILSFFLSMESQSRIVVNRTFFSSSLLRWFKSEPNLFVNVWHNHWSFSNKARRSRSSRSTGNSMRSSRIIRIYLSGFIHHRCVRTPFSTS